MGVEMLAPNPPKMLTGLVIADLIGSCLPMPARGDVCGATGAVNRKKSAARGLPDFKMTGEQEIVETIL